MTFGEYMKKLRKAKGLTLKQVEEAASVSNAYISQFERGLRNPPHPDILKRIAKCYDVPQEEILTRAGYLDLPKESDLSRRELDRAFQYAISDPKYHHGTRLRDASLTIDGKRFIVEMYQKATGKKLLGE